MTSAYTHKMANTFGQRCETYDTYATVQKNIARTLTGFLPDLSAPRILEIGCGTGFLTRHLFEKYPQGEFDITDVSPDMVSFCRGHLQHKNARFFTADANDDGHFTNAYDVIVSAMALQWTSNPTEVLRNLNTIAPVYYAVPGNDHFQEWQSCLNDLGLSYGGLPERQWPHIIDGTYKTVAYDSGLSFLRLLKKTGVSTARKNHTPLKTNEIRTAMRRLDTHYNSHITWHTVYGHIPS